LQGTFSDKTNQKRAVIMSWRLTTALAAALALSGCDGNPFLEDTTVAPPAGTDTPPETVDPTDPNVTPNNKFAFSRDENLTLNAVSYDATSNQLVINNLPFDGPAGVYTQVTGAAASGVPNITRGLYESQQTPTTGVLKYYAMFVRSDFLEASAAAGRDWGDFGYAGANINRDSFALPASGEYVYRGVYGGTRTFDDRGGIELITGNVTLLLDIDDLDPSGGIQGAIVGDVTNRLRIAPSTRSGGALPDISLKLASFNTATGTWEAGEVETTGADTRVRDTGRHEGMIAGPNGQEMGGYLVMEGVADVQRTRYEVVQWRLTETLPVIIGGVDTGLTTTNVRSGSVSGLEGISNSDLQAIVDGGGVLPSLFSANRSTIPEGAVIVNETFSTLDFRTDFNAREVGVFVSDVVTP
jgi:hypothetical protein